MDAWIADRVEALAATAEEELGRLVSIPSPTGDHAGADAMAHALAELIPAGAELSRPESSTQGHPADLCATLTGRGEGRLLLLGHLDTVVGLDAHQPPRVAGDRLVAPGAYDMKGGLVLATAVMRALSERPDAFAAVELLVVGDEEWRQVPLRHAAGAGRRFDACLCFEGGEPEPGGSAAIVRRKGASVLRIEAHGTASHAGAAPLDGRSALLALGQLASQLVQVTEDPESGLTVVPTVVRAGESLNTVPATGSLVCDVRGWDQAAMDSAPGRVPGDLDGVTLRALLEERFPPMDCRVTAAPVLEMATELLGRPISPLGRGGSSDAAFFAREVPVTFDGLGPLGGEDHSPREFVFRDSFGPQLELGLALALAAIRNAPRTSS